MYMIVLDRDIIPTLVKRGGKMVVMIGSDECGYCKAIKPFFETMSTIYPEIVFYFLEASAADSVRTLIDYEGIPALASFNSGRLVQAAEGGLIENVLTIIDSLTLE